MSARRPGAGQTCASPRNGPAIPKPRRTLTAGSGVTPAATSKELCTCGGSATVLKSAGCQLQVQAKFSRSLVLMAHAGRAASRTSPGPGLETAR